MNLTNILYVLAALVPSVILHEVMHGVVALHYGDDTAKRAGRLTLNPIPHIDPIGTIVLPTILALSGLGAFGWAKPVPVRIDRLRDPRNHGLLVSLAGPATNIVLAVVAAIVMRVALPGAVSGTVLDTVPARLLTTFGIINVILAAFNLIPLPPLDGSAVVERLLPQRLLGGWHQLRRYSMPAVLIVVLVFPSVLNGLFTRALHLWARLL